jgi:hypothetical protein
VNEEPARFCPRCGTQRAGDLPYCAGCGLQLDAPPAQGPRREPESRGGGGGRVVLGLLITLLAGVFLFVPFGQTSSGPISYWQAHDLCASGIGVLGSALSGSVASSCSTVNLLWGGSLLAIVLGVVLLLSGALASGRVPGPSWSPNAPSVAVAGESQETGPASVADQGRTWPAWGVLLGVVMVMAIVVVLVLILQSGNTASGGVTGCSAGWQVSGENAYVEMQAPDSQACSQPPDTIHAWVSAPGPPSEDRPICQGTTSNWSFSVYDSGLALIGGDVCTELGGSPGSS